MEDLRPRGLGRIVLRALAIVSALGFLALVMVQAMAFYAPPTPAATRRQPTRDDLLSAPTKAAPVVHPPRLARPRPAAPADDGLLFPATKAGSLGRLRQTEPRESP